MSASCCGSWVRAISLPSSTSSRSPLPVIAKQFHVSKSTVALSVTSSLIGYIIGAFADSTIGDKWGCQLSLDISVGVFSAGTALTALSSGVVMLIVFRFIAGLGIGAEIAAVTTYIAEISPAPLRGRYTSWATTAAYAGFAVVPFVARALVPSFASGWRVLFLIGSLGGVTILFLRRGMPPSPPWLVTQDRTQEASEAVAAAEQTARETMDEELPRAEPVPDEAPAERFPIRALLRPPMSGRVALFVVIWFVYYISAPCPWLRDPLHTPHAERIGRPQNARIERAQDQRHKDIHRRTPAPSPSAATTPTSSTNTSRLKRRSLE